MSDMREALTKLEREIDARWPGSYWILGKGRTRPYEPLWGLQVFNADTGAVLGEAEGDTPYDAIDKAFLVFDMTSKRGGQ